MDHFFYKDGEGNAIVVNGNGVQRAVQRNFFLRGNHLFALTNFESFRDFSGKFSMDKSMKKCIKEL